MNGGNGGSQLHDLLQERDALAPMRHAVPHMWALLEAAIARAEAAEAAGPACGATGADARHARGGGAPGCGAGYAGYGGVQGVRGGAVENRKRVRLAVPAERYPEYNFVGRLLGPRGSTLRALERESGCKIMIRGKGSIRKDKEAEVQGKPGWEHVFNEPLHVVVEVSEALEDADAVRALIRAKEAVELLLVPVPEERDGLKRQQLRDLAILNGTFRGVALGPAPGQHPMHAQMQHHHGSQLPAEQGMPPRMCHSASILPPSTVAGSSIHAFGPHPLLGVSDAAASASAPRAGRSVPHAGSAPMPLHGVPGGAVAGQSQPGFGKRRALSATLSSASSSCTAASSPPPMGSAWGAASGGAMLSLDGLGQGFLGESAATSYYRQKTPPSSAPPPRADFTSCSSLGEEEDESRGSSCANSEASGGQAMSPNSSARGLVFMGSDFYNGAFANTNTGSGDGSGGQAAGGEEEMPVSALSRRVSWARSNSSKSKSPQSPQGPRQVSFAHSSSSEQSAAHGVEQLFDS